MQLRHTFFLVIPFLLCFTTKIGAQSLDSLIYSTLSENTLSYLNSENELNKPIFLKVQSIEQSIEFETRFLSKNVQLSKMESSDIRTIEISHKGTILLSKNEAQLSGVLLVRIISSDQILKSKRIAIEKTVSDSRYTSSTVQHWDLSEQNTSKKSFMWGKMVEPLLILASMGVSVYLLYAVRS